MNEARSVPITTMMTELLQEAATLPTNGSVKSELSNGRRLPYQGKCNTGERYLITCTC